MKRKVLLTAIALALTAGSTVSYAAKDKDGRQCRSSDRYWWFWGGCR